MSDLSSENIDSMQKITRRKSAMRQATFEGTENASHPAKNEDERKLRIVSRRGVFKWLHVAFSSDLVYGSWYYVVGSLLTALIPCFPLINLYINDAFWPKSGFLPITENAACYALLVFMGVMYTIGSWAFLRAVEHPPKTPLFEWRHFASDELFAMWMFAVGTIPSVPVMFLYVAYNPEDGSFFLALIICCLFSFASVGAALCCYPKDGENFHPEYIPTTYLSRLFCTCLCKGSAYHRHLQNDWLVVCWVVVLGCVFACVVSAGLTMYEASEHYARGIFDYATGLVDCLLFLVGSMYFVAGSYPVEEGNAHGAVHDLEGGSKSGPQPISTSSGSGSGSSSEMVAIPPPRSSPTGGGSEKNELHKVAAATGGLSSAL